MSIEDRLEELTGALEANTEILKKLYDLKVGDVETRSAEDIKGSIAAQEDAMHEENIDAESDLVEEPAPKPVSKKKTSKKKVSKKKAAKKKQRSTKPASTIEDVRAALVEIDRDDAKAILKSFGVGKLKELSPSDYDAAIAKAQEDDEL